MSTLFASFVAAIVVVATAYLTQVLIRRRVARRLRGLELRPNCLLTRHPIGFVVGPRSLFTFFDRLSVDVPSYLREHGYEVFLLEIPRNANDPALAISNALDSMRERCHLIGSSEFERLFSRIATKAHPMVASLTLIDRATSKRQASRKPTKEDFKPLATAIERFTIDEKPKSFESRFLELAISLAERDAMMSD